MTARWTPKRDEPLFHRDGDLLVPGALTRGPWYQGTLHGSAMLAAIARAAEGHPTEVERQVVRLTVDMMRAAPMAPLRVETTEARSGKSIDFVDIAMYADDELCVRGSALRMRVADLVVDEPEDAPPPPPPPPAGDSTGESPFDHPGSDQPAFHHAIDVSVDVDHEVVWFRLAVPVVEGEHTTSTVTVAAIADWTYAVPHLLRSAQGVPRPTTRAVHAINADTTINTFRPLSGDWVGLRTTAHTGSLGAGTSGAHLYDAAGSLGFSAQSVLVRGPSGAPLRVKEM
jgi:acyl-coenzyme A thioesterase PaaI-like protein